MVGTRYNIENMENLVLAEAQGYYAQGAGTRYNPHLLSLFDVTCVVNVCGSSV